MLYQGSLLLSVLSWAGLIINGIVAFILPLVLALRAASLREERNKAMAELTVNIPATIIPTIPTISTPKEEPIPEEEGKEVSPLMSYQQGLSLLNNMGSNSLYISASPTPNEAEGKGEGGRKEGGHSPVIILSPTGGVNTTSNNNACCSPLYGVISPLDQQQSNTPAALCLEEETSSQSFSCSSAPTEEEIDFSHPLHITTASEVNPLPAWLNPYRSHLIKFIIVAYVAIIVGTMIEDAWLNIAPPIEK